MAKAADSAESLTEKEEWRPVSGWEGIYEVSSLGQVRSLDRTVTTALSNGRVYKRFYRSIILRPTIHPRHGYPIVILSAPERRKTAGVHILVCEAFHGPRPHLRDAAHNDGDRKNAAASNIRWATRKENMADTLLHGTRNRGERHGMAKLTADAVRKIRLSGDRTVFELAEQFGVSFQTISNVRCRKSWKHI